MPTSGLKFVKVGLPNPSSMAGITCSEIAAAVFEFVRPLSGVPTGWDTRPLILRPHKLKQRIEALAFFNAEEQVERGADTMGRQRARRASAKLFR